MGSKQSVSIRGPEASAMIKSLLNDQAKKFKEAIKHERK
jgi:hypothetical protein